MDFAAGVASATFTMGTATGFAGGDVLTIVAPATPDATLANLAWTLTGTPVTRLETGPDATTGCRHAPAADSAWLDAMIHPHFTPDINLGHLVQAVVVVTTVGGGIRRRLSEPARRPRSAARRVSRRAGRA